MRIATVAAIALAPARFLAGRSQWPALTRPLFAAMALILPVALVLGGCSGSAKNTGGSPTNSASAPCDAAPMVAALQADYGTKVRIVYNNHLVCAGNLAEISVMVDNLESAKPGYAGPVGSPHGALMIYSGGAWHQVDLSRPNPYCTSDGAQTAAVPPALGTVCGIQ